MNTKRRVLVTGCAGFLGSHLSEQLVREGHEVVGVDCFTDFYPRSVKEENVRQLREQSNFRLLELDLSTDRMEGLLEGIDQVFHLAAQAGVRGSFGDSFQDYVRNNIQATQRLLEQAVLNPVEAFVYASSSSVYGNALSYPTSEEHPRCPLSPYGMTKLATEEIAAVYHRNEGVPVVGMRYFTAYGPRQRPDMAFHRFLCRALDGDPITILGDGQQLRDFTYVADVVQATVAAAERGTRGSVYNVGGGKPIKLLAVIELLEQLLERPVEIRRRPAAAGDPHRTCADGSRAANELGISPSTTLSEGLAAELDWISDTRKPGSAGIAIAPPPPVAQV